MKIGTYAVEQDYSHYVKQLTKTVFAVIGTATKGPINEPTLCTSTQELVNKFGLPKLGEDRADYGLYAAMYFLSQSSKLYFIRAASDKAAAATVTILGDSPDPEGSEGIATESAVTFSALDKGTGMAGFTLTVKTTEYGMHNGDEYDTPFIYDFTIKNRAGVVVETIKGIECGAGASSMFPEFSSKYIEVTKEIIHPQLGLVDGEYTFTGGNDGTADIDYTKFADTLLSEYIDINLLATPGVSDTDTISYMIKLAGKRGDCLYLVDPPQGLSKAGMIEWIQKYYKEVNEPALDPELDLSYGALYYDWATIYDSFNKTRVTVPPSVYVAATYARSDKLADVWYAPAGLTRGKVNGVLEIDTPISKKDAEDLYADGVNINPLYNDPQVGVVLWGQKTLQKEDTALNRVNVRRLMNYLKKVITAACNYLTFEPNDRITWNSFELKVKPILESVKANRGVYEYRIIKGETIVTDDDIDNYRMPCMVLIRPTKAAEEIPIYFAITSTGADFNEVLAANGIVENN